MSDWKGKEYPTPPKEWRENKFGREADYKALDEVEDTKGFRLTLLGFLGLIAVVAAVAFVLYDVLF